MPAPGFSSRAGRSSEVMGLGCYGRHVMRALGKRLGAWPPAISVAVSQRGLGADERWRADVASPTEAPAAAELDSGT